MKNVSVIIETNKKKDDVNITFLADIDVEPQIDKIKNILIKGIKKVCNEIADLKKINKKRLTKLISIIESGIKSGKLPYVVKKTIYHIELHMVYHEPKKFKVKSVRNFDLKLRGKINEPVDPKKIKDIVKDIAQESNNLNDFITNMNRVFTKTKVLIDPKINLYQLNRYNSLIVQSLIDPNKK